jgi:hypothetical protein
MDDDVINILLFIYFIKINIQINNKNKNPYFAFFKSLILDYYF